MTSFSQPDKYLQRTEVLLQRLPGTHGLGLIPWLVPLLFGVGTVAAATTGAYSGQWVRFGLLLNVCAWLLQGLALRLIRRRALEIPPTAAGGVVALITFALIGAVGAVVLATGYAIASIPDRPAFFDPLSVFIFSVLTWVFVASIVALSYSWRDQLNDTLAAATAKVTEMTLRSTETAEIDERQRQVVIGTLQTKVMPKLNNILGRLQSLTTDHPDRVATRLQLADEVEKLAQHEIRSLAHLLHPQGTALGLTPVLNSVVNEFRGQVELRVQLTHELRPLSPLSIRELAITLTEILNVETAMTQEIIDVVVLDSADELKLIVRTGDKVITKIIKDQEVVTQSKKEVSTANHWFRFPPSAATIPWLGISLLNAFSVVVATLLAETSNWYATAVDVSIITAGTFFLFLLVRPAIIGNWSTTAQWIFVATFVACLGGIAGAAWGTALGEETLSLGLMGVICALSVGLFAPARKVWSSETKRLQQQMYLDEIEIEYTNFALQNVTRLQRTAAADILHSVIQSRLLAIAGSVGGANHGAIPQTTIDALRHLQGTVVPELILSLATRHEGVTQSLLTQEVLADTWPGTNISMKTTARVPNHLEPLVNGIILEAVSNALVHGGATAIEISIGVWPAAIEITVEDDGTGVAQNARKGLGLKALQAAGPNLTLSPRPTGGARLHLRVPYVASRQIKMQSVTAVR